MKALPASLAAVAIALVSGFAGYRIGQSSSPAGHSGAVTSPSPDSQTKRSERPATSGLRKQDIPAFRLELSKESNPLKRFRSALDHLEDWVKADPADALAWLKEQPRSERRDEVIGLALTQFSEQDPAAAAAWAEANLTGNDLNNSVLLIIEEWAVQNGAEAADWLHSRPASHERDAALEGTLFTWSANDPEAAIAYLEKNPGEGELASILRYATYAGWAKSDPENAVRASLESSRRHQDPEQFANTLANWATIDLPASSEWLSNNLPDGPERAAAVVELAGMYAEQSPESGISWLNRLKPGPEQETAANKLIAEWASSDPSAAADWAVKQKLAPLTRDTIQELTHGFLIRDPDAFDAWRASLPAGPLKDYADAVSSPEEDGGDEDR